MRFILDNFIGAIKYIVRFFIDRYVKDSKFFRFLREYQTEIKRVRIAVLLIANIVFLFLFWKIILLNDASLINNSVILNKIATLSHAMLLVLGVKPFSLNILKMLILTFLIVFINLLVLYINQFIFIIVAGFIVKYSCKSYANYCKTDIVYYMNFLSKGKGSFVDGAVAPSVEEGEASAQVSLVGESAVPAQVPLVEGGEVPAQAVAWSIKDYFFNMDWSLIGKVAFTTVCVSIVIIAILERFSGGVGAPGGFSGLFGPGGLFGKPFDRPTPPSASQPVQPSEANFSYGANNNVAASEAEANEAATGEDLGFELLQPQQPIQQPILQENPVIEQVNSVGLIDQGQGTIMMGDNIAELESTLQELKDEDALLDSALQVVKDTAFKDALLSVDQSVLEDAILEDALLNSGSDILAGAVKAFKLVCDISKIDYHDSDGFVKRAAEGELVDSIKSLKGNEYYKFEGLMNKRAYLASKLALEFKNK